MPRLKQCLAAAVLLLACVTVVRANDLEDEINRIVFRDLYYEAATCAAYYTIFSAYMLRDPDPKAVGIAEKYKQGALFMIEMTQKMAPQLGVGKEAANTAIQTLADGMKDVMANNANNLPILFQKYSEDCKAFHDDPLAKKQKYIDEELKKRSQ